MSPRKKQDTQRGKNTQDKGIEPVSRLERRFIASTIPPHQDERRYYTGPQPSTTILRVYTTRRKPRRQTPSKVCRPPSILLGISIIGISTRYDQTLAQQWFCASLSFLPPTYLPLCITRSFRQAILLFCILLQVAAVLCCHCRAVLC